MKNATNLSVQTMTNAPATSRAPQAKVRAAQPEKSFQRVMQKTKEMQQQPPNVKQNATAKQRQAPVAQTQPDAQQPQLLKTTVRMLNVPLDTESMANNTVTDAEIFALLSGIPANQNEQENSDLSGVRMLESVNDVEAEGSLENAKEQLLGALLGADAEQSEQENRGLSDIRILESVNDVEAEGSLENAKEQLLGALFGADVEQSEQANWGLSGIRVLESVNGVGIGESLGNVKGKFLGALFGADAIKDVDMEQSDAEILKDVYKNLTDPAAQFAMLLMMAFMQDNPDASITDMASQLDQATWSNENISPVQKVFTAITKMQQQDESLESSDTLDTLMQMVRNGKTPASVAKPNGEPSYKELEALLLSQSTTKQTEQPGAARLPAQDTAAQLQQGQAQFKDAVTQARQMMQSANTPVSTDEQANATGGTGQKRETGVAIDVEKLQAQVDANSFMRNTSHQAYQLRQAGAVLIEQPEVDPMELINQVRTGILSGVSKGENEFVMKLRPEGLGELTIRLVETGAKMSLSIVASSEQTQKLLTREMANLQAVMKPLNVEVQPVATSEQASSSMEHSMSGRFAQQQFGEHNHGEQFDGNLRQLNQMSEDSLEQELGAVGYPSSIGTSALDTYI